MSYQYGSGGGMKRGTQAPKGYVPGLGRGAAGFTTRSDIGNIVGPTGGGGGDDGAPGDSMVSSGSRAAELRAAKLAAQKMQQQQRQQSSLFGEAPKGYVAGAGRGAGAMGAGFGRGGGGGESDTPNAEGPTPIEKPITAGGAAAGAAVEGQYDDDDDEADQIWAAIDERMNAKRRKTSKPSVEQDPGASARARIGAQFRELKEQLATVKEEDWMKIPDVGDHSLKYKKSQQNRQDVFTPLTDSLIEQRHKLTSMQTNTTTTTEANTGGASTIANMSGLGQARGTVLGMSLDKMSDSVSGQTVVDPQGYLTRLSTSSTAQLSAQNVGDIHKARLLLKSVRDTNPKHGPGWIASARVEEAAGKVSRARKLIQEGCEICPTFEDVWLEAARLHPPEVAKSILATAVRRIPNSVKLFLKATDLELHLESKKAVLRKAIEANPTSITLWKAAIDLEDADDAKVLLSVAVERVPHAVELWLALARLETYDNARRVLNQARRALPTERAIWIAAAKLEESQNHPQICDKIMDRAFSSLMGKQHQHKQEENGSNNDNSDAEVIVTRAQWLQEAEAAEKAEAPLTAAAIVRHSIGIGVDKEDQQRTWADDAKNTLARGSVATARAILAHALQEFPSKRVLWMQAVELERNHGSKESLDDVLKAASERLPRVEIFWLLRAKEQWIADQVDTAREILTQAFAANPDSESVWLAAAKLEWETGEIERARVLLQRARERAPTNRVYMKSALLERERGRFPEALELLEEGMSKYPDFPKLYMMGGQICSHDLQPKTKKNLEKARKIYQRGLKECPNNVVLWTLASRLEEQAHTYSDTTNGDSENSSRAGVGVTKARSLLELARLKNPKNDNLWLEAVRLERRNGNAKLAETLMARALQECPSSGLLLAENILTAPRVEQKSKSTIAIKRCPESPLVIAAVASLFSSERKLEKARKWFERAVVMNPDIGDSWARYYAFELTHGTKQQAATIKERCIRAEPKHGEVWQSVMKDMANRPKTTADGLEIATKQFTHKQLK